MCIAIPMQVVEVAPGRARVIGRGAARMVDTALVGEVEIGQWLLVFLDGARERIDAQRAREIDRMFEWLADSRRGEAAFEPDFPLPSAMDAAQLAALTGAAPVDSDEE